MSREDSIERMIEVFEHPIKNALKEESPRASQPTHIKVPLKAHQLAMIEAMDKKEKECVSGFTIESEVQYSQFAILGDKVGSGKTLTTLGYLSQRKSSEYSNIFSRMNKYSKTSFWSHKPVHSQDCSGNTLIIVPHTLFHQWKFAIEKQTTLSFLEVKTVKAFDKDDFIQKIKDSDITLMSNTIIKTFMGIKEREQIQWSRVIFDEMDSVHFTSTIPMPSANFYWLITATWSNILFHGLYMYLSNEYLERRIAEGLSLELSEILQHGQITNINNFYFRYDIRSAQFFSKFLTRHPNRGSIILQSSCNFLQQSWKYPEIKEKKILCAIPISYRLVETFVSPEIRDLLNGGDIKGALEKLGVSNTSQSSLVSALCDTFEKELDKLKKTLAFKETMEYSCPQAKETSLQSLNQKITSLKDRISSIKERILHVENEICAICYDEPKTPTIVLCCSRLFCGNCILQCIQKKPECPLCRSALTFCKLKHIMNDTEKTNEIVKEIQQIPRKRDALLQVIKDTPSGKFLVFNRYDNPFLELEPLLLELNVKVASLRGNKDCISSTLKQFEKGSIQVLLMNSMETGAGIDLKSATHIILMHSMRKEEEQQIIGRAMRLGRTEPLTLIRLLHENEG